VFFLRLLRIEIFHPAKSAPAMGFSPARSARPRGGIARKLRKAAAIARCQHPSVLRLAIIDGDIGDASPSLRSSNASRRAARIALTLCRIFFSVHDSFVCTVSISDSGSHEPSAFDLLRVSQTFGLP
jgi:hypothetical protein